MHTSVNETSFRTVKNEVIFSSIYTHKTLLTVRCFYTSEVYDIQYV